MIRTIFAALFAVFAFLSGSEAQAACSGSGVVWNCAAGSTAVEVQTAVNSSSDGATITVANGSYSWVSGINFSIAKATTLICATVGGCTVTGGGVIGENATCDGTSNKLQRVSGFIFSGGNNPRLWWAANGDGIPCLRTNIRIDHNTFTGTDGGGTIMYFGHFTATDNYIYGVVDHNTVMATAPFYLLVALNGPNNPPLGSQGGPNNLFVEDNTLTSTTMDSGGGPVCVDGWGGAAIVVRYNTFTNCRVAVHGVPHAWGPRNLEVYNNSITFTSGAGDPFTQGYRGIHHQGSGTFMVFNNTMNTFSGNSGSAIALLHYRSWTVGWNGIARCDGTVAGDGNRAPTDPNFGYPCFRQPGRDPAGNLFPIYVFNNKFGDGSKIDLSCEDEGESNPNTCVNHLVNNRDYFNAVGNNPQTSPTSPFNGTTGMGFGALANRPITCSTALTETQDAGKGGVGYFATNQGPQGALYQCSATNTWTLQYTPFTYPHPLVGTIPIRQNFQNFVEWAASASAGTADFTGYNIYRCNPVPCTPTMQIGTATTNMYFDTGLANSTTYRYKISAYGPSGETFQATTTDITTYGIPTVHDVSCSGDIASALTTAINASAAGDIVNIGAGSCSVGAMVTLTDACNAVNIQGQGIGLTTITANSGFLDCIVSGANAPTMHVAEMSLTGSGVTAPITVQGNGNPSRRGPFHIDHLNINYPAASVGISLIGNIWGMTDNLTCTTASGMCM